MPTKTQTPWSEIRKRVLKLIDTLKVTTSKQIGGATSSVERKMKFVEFSEMLGFHNTQVWRSIRGTDTPSGPLEAAVREWVSKQEE